MGLRARGQLCKEQPDAQEEDEVGRTPGLLVGSRVLPGERSALLGSVLSSAGTWAAPSSLSFSAEGVTSGMLL